MNTNIQKILDKVTDVVTSEEATALAIGLAVVAASWTVWAGSRILTALVDAKIEEIKSSSSNS